MREHKFRVWDNKRNEWYGASNKEHSLLFYGFHIFGECTLLCSPPLDDLQYLEIDEYTGLKDKNGKEIYEGDILLGYYEDFGMPASNKKHYEVKWVERSTGYEPFIDYDIECERFFSIETCEVIGNIHENPELLEI